MNFYQWYDAKVRLPKLGEEVLCVDKHNRFYVATYSTVEAEHDPFLANYWNHGFWCGNEPGEPIYWMRFQRDFPEF